MRDLILFAFFLSAIYFTFKRPYIGVCAWLWVALLAPAEWAFGFSRELRLNLTIVIITFVAYVFVQKDKSMTLTKLGVMVTIFVVWTILSSIFSTTVPFEDMSYLLTKFLKTVALFYFVLMLIKSRLHVETLLWAIFLSLSAYAAMEAIKFVLSGGGHRIIGRAGRIEDRNELAVAINMAIPLAIYLYSVTKHKYLKMAVMGIIGLNVLAIMGTYSRGGMIGLTILAIAFWFKSKHKILLSVAGIIAVIGIVSFAPQEWKERQTTIKTAATEDGSFIGRLWAWKISTMIAIDNPLLGQGFGAVTQPQLWFYYAPLTPDFPPIETPPISPDRPPKAAHNIYMQVLGDHGFFGLGMFLLIILFAFQINSKTKQMAREGGIDWIVKLSNAFSLCLIGYCITGANVSLAYFDLLYAIFALIAVQSVIVHKELAKIKAPAT